MVSDKTYKLIFWCVVLIVLLLSLLPISAPELELFQWQDKLHHFITYSGLCFLGIQAYGQNHSVWVIGFILVLFGLVIELAQSLTYFFVRSFVFTCSFGRESDVRSEQALRNGYVALECMHMYS